jgi:DNA polymerase-3 subunit beta
VVISTQEHTITFTKNTLTISVHSIKGQFPDYRQLFPKQYTTEVLIEKEALVKALSTTSLFIENYTPLSCQVHENTLTLLSKNETFGSATQVLDITKEGEGIQTHYNNRYFLDVFPHLQNGLVTLSFTVFNRPVVIRNKEDTSFLYLLMPVNR